MKSQLKSPSEFPRWKGLQRRIGLTGGIASGKSSVGNYLQEIKALPILDADLYAKEALNPGTISTIKVFQRYGEIIRSQSNNSEISINRKALSKIIFSNKSEREWLQKLIHPIVTEKLKIELTTKKDYPIIILMIPLIFEAKLTSLCNEVWVVYCNRQQQKERLISRDSLSNEEAQNIIEAQWSIEYKKKLADYVIDNSGKDKEWISQLEQII